MKFLLDMPFVFCESIFFEGNTLIAILQKVCQECDSQAHKAAGNSGNSGDTLLNLFP